MLDDRKKFRISSGKFGFINPERVIYFNPDLERREYRSL
jgi:hypothetical protein